MGLSPKIASLCVWVMNCTLQTRIDGFSMYIRKRTLLCIKVPNRGRRGDFFLSFFFYLSRVQKRSRYGEAVTGTGNNALYRKQNYDRGSPKEEQFLNGVHLKSLISRYKACVKYKTVAVFLCIIV